MNELWIKVEDTFMITDLSCTVVFLVIFPATDTQYFCSQFTQQIHHAVRQENRSCQNLPAAREFEIHGTL